MDEVFIPALILDRIPYRDRDFVLTLLTRGQGLVSALARSVRGSRRRFGGLDLFVLFQAHLRMQPPPKLSSLVEIEPVRQFPGILADLDRLEVGQAMLVITRDLLRDAPAPAGVFDLVATQFERLENAPRTQVHRPLLDLCVGIVAELGHMPEGPVCPSCGRGLDPGIVMLDGGSIVCIECGKNLGGAAFDPRVLNETGTTRREVLAFLTHLMSAVLGRPYRIPLVP